MEYWIMSANRKMYNHDLAFSELGTIDWRDSNRKFNEGDIVYIYTTSPTSKIQFKCIVLNTKVSDGDKIDDTKFWEPDFLENPSGRTYVRLKLLSKIDNVKLHLNKLLEHGLKAAPQGPGRLTQETIDYIENITSNYGIYTNEDESYFEGNQTKVLTTQHERNPLARKKCLDHYGYSCKVCNFNFELFYGSIGKEFIHVHHIVPIHKIKEKYIVDPIKDLIPVCPNCHAMLHRKNDKDQFYSVDELRKQII